MRGIPRQAVHGDCKILGTNRTARQVAKTDSICKWNTDMYGLNPEKEGARAYYDSIFALYASWGVDFIKCDDIARELPHEESELIMLSKALHGCGRPMVLSLSPGPALLEKAELYKQISNMWRSMTSIVRMQICGESPMISGISGNCYMICFQEQKNGAPMQVQGTGRMPICFRSDRYGRYMM